MTTSTNAPAAPPSYTESTGSTSSPINNAPGSMSNHQMSQLGQPHQQPQPHSRAHTFNPDTKPGMSEHRYTRTATATSFGGGASAGPSAMMDMNEWDTRDGQRNGPSKGPTRGGKVIGPAPGQQAQPGLQQGQVDSNGLHWYRNAAGHTFSSPYPPSHPAMQCLLSPEGHLTKTYHGWLGVVVGVLFFPIGCIMTAMDEQTRCKRCGVVTDTGCYSG